MRCGAGRDGFRGGRGDHPPFERESVKYYNKFQSVVYFFFLGVKLSHLALDPNSKSCFCIKFRPLLDPIVHAVSECFYEPVTYLRVQLDLDGGSFVCKMVS